MDLICCNLACVVAGSSSQFPDVMCDAAGSSLSSESIDLDRPSLSAIELMVVGLASLTHIWIWL